MSVGPYLSLGAGVQSSTLLLMAVHGEVPRPAAAVFADTGWEPAGVYAWLDRLERIAAEAGIPVARVSGGDLRSDALSRDFAAMPLYARDAAGRLSQLRRQCTRSYKVDPIQRWIRAQGATHRAPAELWLGVSWDEVTRMRPARVKYVRHRWPLVEMRMDRAACLRWLEERGYPRPPKSACIGCPFHDAGYWRELRTRPDEWADAVAFDRAVRRLPRVAGECFVHRSGVPLDEVDLRTAEERGQLSLWDGECEGHCGL